jgi:hypothetical protein
MVRFNKGEGGFLVPTPAITRCTVNVNFVTFKICATDKVSIYVNFGL